MKQFKRILAILLIAAMAFCLFACDSSSSKDDDEDDDKTEESSVAESSGEASSKEESSKEESSEEESSEEESSEEEFSEEESSEEESSEEESSEAIESSEEESSEAAESSEEESSEVIVDADTIEGKYMLYSMKSDGETYDYETILLAGVEDSYLEFYDDGTVDVYFTDEEVMTGDYDLDAGTITVEGESIELSVKGEKATITMEGEEMTFVIESSDLFENVDVSVDVGDEDIVGKYMLYAMASGEEFIDYPTIKEIGYDSAYIELKEDGTFIMVFPDEDPEEGTYDAETMILTDSIGDEIAFEVLFGMLYIEIGEDSMTFLLEGDELFEVEDPDYSIDFGEEETDIVGKYLLYEVTSGDEYVDYETIKEIGYDSAYIELKEDGTFILVAPEQEPEEGTYDAETMILTDSIGDEIPFDVFFGMLTIEIGEDSLTFVIEGDVLLD